MIVPVIEINDIEAQIRKIEEELQELKDQLQYKFDITRVMEESNDIIQAVLTLQNFILKNDSEKMRKFWDLHRKKLDNRGIVKDNLIV